MGVSPTRLTLSLKGTAFLPLTAPVTRTRYSPSAGTPPVAVLILKSPTGFLAIATSALSLSRICRPIDESALSRRKVIMSSLFALRIRSSYKLPAAPLSEVLGSSFPFLSSPKVSVVDTGVGAGDVGEVGLGPRVLGFGVGVGLGVAGNSPVPLWA